MSLAKPDWLSALCAVDQRLAERLIAQVGEASLARIAHAMTKKKGRGRRAAHLEEAWIERAAIIFLTTSGATFGHAAGLLWQQLQSDSRRLSFSMDTRGNFVRKFGAELSSRAGVVDEHWDPSQSEFFAHCISIADANKLTLRSDYFPTIKNKLLGNLTYGEEDGHSPVTRRLVHLIAASHRPEARWLTTWQEQIAKSQKVTAFARSFSDLIPTDTPISQVARMREAASSFVRTEMESHRPPSCKKS